MKTLTFGIQENSVGSGLIYRNKIRLTGPPIPTLPVPPTIISAVRTSATSVTVTLQDNSGNETNFTVQHKTSLNGTWTNSSTTIPAKVGIGGTVIYVKSGLTIASTYWFRACARNAVGNGEFSNIVGPVLPL